MLKFQNKTILVTGSGTGIGQAITKKFVENGASAIILGSRGNCRNARGNYQRQTK